MKTNSLLPASWSGHFKQTSSNSLLLCLLAYVGLTMPSLVFSQNVNDAIEPTVKGPGMVDLLVGGNLDAWKVPPTHWELEAGSIVGQTGGEKLERPEWIYTKQRFGDFEFTCESKLSGDAHRNSGIYFRANVFIAGGHGDQTGKRKAFEAPSGYEFDLAYNAPGKKKFNGTLGDYYVRPALRIFPDPIIIDQVHQLDDWNRMTLRARGNHLEYWLNGVKIMDYIDNDPKGSREGLIGFQIHNGSVMKVEYRNIRVLPLPRP
jgi:Domain of Unknown Function (DUF1080)